MKFISLVTFTLSILMGTTSVYATDDHAAQANSDETTVVGACMVQKFKEKMPPIPQAKLDKCADADSKEVPACLGLSDEEYMGFVNFCVAQLTNAKCVSAKMKVPLLQYANCGYEHDPAACFKGLGYSVDDIVKLSTDCQKQTQSN